MSVIQPNGPVVESLNQLTAQARMELVSFLQPFFADRKGAGGGGGGLTVARMIFTEQAGITLYSARLPISAGTRVVEVLIFTLAVGWNGTTSAKLSVGDTLNGPFSYYGFGANINLKTKYQQVYDPTSGSSTLGVGDGFGWENLEDGGNLYENGIYNVYTTLATQTVQQTGAGTLYDADDEIVATVAVVDPDASPTGVTLVEIWYFTPPTPLTVTAT